MSASDLIPFKPGAEWKGNAKGRPKGTKNLSTLLKQALKQYQVMDNALPGDRNAAQALVESMIYHAIKGNPAFAAQIFNRVDGLQKEEEPQPKMPFAKIQKKARKKADARKRDRGPNGPAGGVP